MNLFDNGKQKNTKKQEENCKQFNYPICSLDMIYDSCVLFNYVCLIVFHEKLYETDFSHNEITLKTIPANTSENQKL